MSSTSSEDTSQYSTIAKKYNTAMKQEFAAEEGRYMRMLKDWAELPEVSVNHETLLDVGCGEGTITDFLKRNFVKTGRVVGIDDSQAMIEIAQHDYPSIDFKVEDMDKMSFPDESIDFVFSRFAVHYSRDIAKTLREIGRVTRRGGTFFLMDVHPFYTTFYKRSLDYGSKEDVTFFTEHDTSTSIVHPSFTFEEYINGLLQSNWTIKSMHEIFGENSSDEKVTPYRVPTKICFILIKQ